MPGWSYTFCNLATGEELATLPMVGVSYDEKLSAVGSLKGLVPTVDPKVRALDPWAATEPRRTALFVEYDNQIQWGGIVWARSRSEGGGGLRLTAATFDSWLAWLLFRDDLDLSFGQQGLMTTISLWLSKAQGYPGASIGLAGPWSGDGTGETRIDGKLYAATDLKPVADRLANFYADTGVAVEWRVDLGKTAAGRYTKTLSVTDEKLTGPLVLEDNTRPPIVYPAAMLPMTYPGNLLTWTYDEDGSTRGNVAVGAAKGANDTALLAVRTADDVGSDELRAGYPAQSFPVPAPGGNEITQTQLNDLTTRSLLTRLVTGDSLSDLSLVPAALHTIRPGYRARIQITDPSFREWPKAREFSGYRILGKSVTVANGTSPTQVKVDVVPPSDRLPESITFVSQITDVLARLRDLETP